MVDTIDGNNNMDTARSFAASAALSSEQQQQQQPSLSSGRNRNSEGKENEIPSSSNQLEVNSNQTSPLTSSVRNVNFEFDNRGKKENASTSLLSMGAVRLRYDDDCVNDDDDDDDNTTNNNHGGRMEVEHDDVGLFDACNDASCSGDADNGNYDYNNYNDEVQDDDEDDDEDEDGSECSGDTVIAQDDNCPPPPPPNATHEQWNQYYWEWCYGPVDAPATNLEKRHDVDGSWSAMRCAPSKSW